MNFFKKHKEEILLGSICVSFVNCLLDHHYEEIAPLLNDWKESQDA